MLRLWRLRGTTQMMGVRMKSTTAPASQMTQNNTTLTAIKIEQEELENIQRSLPFSRTKIGQFFQDMPTLGNQYLEDATLKNYLRRVMPDHVCHLFFL